MSDKDQSPESVSSPSEKSSSIFSQKYILYFWSGYFLLLALAYYWGYWGAFNINVLEYVTFDDLPQIAAYPLAGTLFYLLIPVVIPVLANLAEKEGNAPRVFKNSEEKAIYESTYKFVEKWFWRFRSFLIYLIIFAALVFLPIVDLVTLFFLVIISILVCKILEKQNFFYVQIPNQEIRFLIAISMVWMPFNIYDNGKLGAYKILRGEQYQYCSIEQLPLDSTSGLPKSKNVRYLGATNEYAFFTTEDGDKNIIFLRKKLDHLVLSQHPPKKPEKEEISIYSTIKRHFAKSDPAPTQIKDEQQKIEVPLECFSIKKPHYSSVRKNYFSFARGR